MGMRDLQKNTKVPVRNESLLFQSSKTQSAVTVIKYQDLVCFSRPPVSCPSRGIQNIRQQQQWEVGEASEVKREDGDFTVPVAKTWRVSSWGSGLT